MRACQHVKHHAATAKEGVSTGVQARLSGFQVSGLAQLRNCVIRTRPFTLECDVAHNRRLHLSRTAGRRTWLSEGALDVQGPGHNALRASILQQQSQEPPIPHHHVITSLFVRLWVARLSDLNIQRACRLKGASDTLQPLLEPAL